MSTGAFIWYDLATPDPAAAAAFYAAVIGWTPEPAPDADYTLFKTGAAARAGLMKLPAQLEAASVPPHWSGYVQVDDVDSMLGRAEAAGATLRYGPSDIPDVGRFAVIADPGGAVFYLYAPREPAQEPAPMTPGTVAWRELHAREPESAFGFYASLFGWEQTQAIPMGAMGTYQLFAYGGLDRGGMMQTQPGMPSHWLFYVAVDDVHAAVARVTGGGGTIVFGPSEVPGGAWTLNCRDPQGAYFALVSPPK
ncbi:MAG: VOC family protein [Acetobacteraceae bacterium]|nr:VOC family protein [Acetobacteraceae bacterium]